MLDGEAGELTETQARFLEIVSRNATRLNGLVDDILAVARIDAGRLTIEREPVELVALVEGEIESRALPRTARASSCGSVRPQSGSRSSRIRGGWPR